MARVCAIGAFGGVIEAPTQTAPAATMGALTYRRRCHYRRCCLRCRGCLRLRLDKLRSSLRMCILLLFKLALVLQPGQNQHMEAIWVKASVGCQTDLVSVS